MVALKKLGIERGKWAQDIFGVELIPLADEFSMVGDKKGEIMILSF